tara:strand:+ start:98 stop:619 length:522 start_codon:yes stop_codon:yes gene_type:complete
MLENKTTTEVRVDQILSTSNPDVFTLVLRQEVKKPESSGDLGFFMPGIVGSNLEKRVAFRNVDATFIEMYNIYESENDNICFFADQIATVVDKAVNCKIVIEETHNQRTWDGGEQQPKVNPKTGDVLTKNGNPIYRNTWVTFDVTEEDTYIAHDKATVKAPDAKAVATEDIPF